MTPPWRATLIAEEWRTQPLLRRDLTERVRFRTGDQSDVLDHADVMVFASTGVHPAPALLQSAVASQAVPIAARLPLYEELLEDGDRGLLFEPGDLEILVAQLTRLLEQPDLLERYGTPGPARPWDVVTDEIEALYGRVAARRHDGRGNGALHQHLEGRPLIDVDLHMHTDHSGDCATPVEALLGEAKARGLGAIAVTDHNEISGALEAREKADGIKVIVGEEVKTADQGEVIGLFIEEKIPRGGTLQEVIAEIKRQGGLVYVPHPFDRLHAVPDYRHLLDVLEDVDAIEVFNPRVAISSFNEEAVRFAEKYRIVGGAGSDAHVTAGLGSVRIRMRDFDGPAGVPRVPARRGHHPQAGLARVRPGAQVPPDQGHPDRRAARGQGAAHPPRRATRRPQVLMHPQEQPPHGLKPGFAVPATDDEIREKYLERAIRELNTLTRELQDCEHCPRGNLMPVLGSGHPQADVFLLKHAPRPAEVEEGVAFYGRAGTALMKSFKRLSIDPLAVYGTLCAKCPVSDPALADPACVARLVEELAIVQPKIVVVMGDEALAVLNDLDIPLAHPLTPEPGVVQRFTPSMEALYVPNIDEALDDETAKRGFWNAFRALGDWYEALPPY